MTNNQKKLESSQPEAIVRDLMQPLGVLVKQP